MLQVIKAQKDIKTRKRGNINEEKSEINNIEIRKKIQNETI